MSGFFFILLEFSLFHLSTREAAENDEDRDVQKETSVNVRVVSSQVSTYTKKAAYILPQDTDIPEI